MKIFLSWSGDQSQAIANALADLLPDILQGIQPWISNHDLAPGTRWDLELGRELEAINFGILCLTRDNLSAPWILFEAGALAKQVQESRVVPYRLGINASDVPFPLAQFQGVDASESGTKRLVQTLNRSMPESIDARRLDRLFERWWPDFRPALEAAARHPIQSTPKRSDRDLIEEMVGLLRGVRSTIVGRPQASGDILRFAEYPDTSIRPHIRTAKDIALSGLNMYRFSRCSWMI